MLDRIGTGVDVWVISVYMEMTELYFIYSLSIFGFLVINSYLWSMALMLGMFSSFRYATAHLQSGNGVWGTV